MTAYVQIRVGDDTFDYSITRGDEAHGMPGVFQYVVRKHSPGKELVVRYFEHYYPHGIEVCVMKALMEVASGTT